MRRFILLLLVSACISLALVPPSDARVRVEKGTYYIDDAEGYAPIINGKKAAAREEAKKIACLDAIEQASRECAGGITTMEQYGSVREKIFKSNSGMVKNFKITSETVSGDMLYVKGTCRLSEKSLDGVLGPEVIAMLGNPRVMIIVDEQIGGKAPFISSVENELMRIFQKAGYLIVDKEQAEALIQLDPKKSFNDPALLTAAAKTLRADIIVVARATAGASAHTKLYGVNMYKTSGQVQIKAVLTQTAYQITSTTFSGGSGKNWVGSPTAGVSGIFQRGVAQTANEIIYKIAYNMASANSSLGGVTVNIKLAGANFNQVEEFESRLREIAGNSGNVFERSYNNGLLEVDVVSSKTARNIASLISDQVEINGFTAQTINARVKAPTPTPNPNPDPTPKPSIVINIFIDNVNDLSDVSDIADSLRKFVGTYGEVSSNYEKPALKLSIVYPPNVSGMKDIDSLAAFLKKESVRIDSVQGDSIKGWKQGGIWLW